MNGGIRHREDLVVRSVRLDDGSPEGQTALTRTGVDSEGVVDQKLAAIWGPVHTAENFHSIGSPERHLLFVRPIRVGGEDAGNICCDLACERDPAVRAWECGVSRSSASDHVYDERRQRDYEQTESAIECSGFHVASCVRVCESKGRFSRNYRRRGSGSVRLSERSLSLKRPVSRQIVLWMPCQTAVSRSRA